MSGDQILALPGRKRRQMPGVGPGGEGGGMLKLRFDWYISCNWKKTSKILSKQLLHKSEIAVLDSRTKMVETHNL